MLNVPADWGLVPYFFYCWYPCTDSLNSLAEALYYQSNIYHSVSKVWYIILSQIGAEVSAVLSQDGLHCIKSNALAWFGASINWRSLSLSLSLSLLLLLFCCCCCCLFLTEELSMAYTDLWSWNDTGFMHHKTSPEVKLATTRSWTTKKERKKRRKKIYQFDNSTCFFPCEKSSELKKSHLLDKKGISITILVWRKIIGGINFKMSSLIFKAQRLKPNTMDMPPTITNVSKCSLYMFLH